VASVFHAADLDDAIRIANDSRFGLGASAWTNDKTSASAYQRFGSGMVFINAWWLPIPIPFGEMNGPVMGENWSHGIRDHKHQDSMDRGGA